MDDETQILIIEDDKDLREGVKILLEGENHIVIEAENGIEGLSKLNEDTDLVILDIMMPGISGIKTCEKIREISNVPVLFLTAKSQDSDKLIGLMAGGDDYLTKPFSYTELLVRVRALLRRYKIYQGKKSSRNNNSIIELAGIKLDMEYNHVIVKGEEINMTDTEYQILKLLMKHPNQIFTAQSLYESVWNEPFFYNCTNTLMVHIRKIRKKIEENPQDPSLIITVWGKGYKFNEKQ